MSDPSSAGTPTEVALGTGVPEFIPEVLVALDLLAVAATIMTAAGTIVRIGVVGDKGPPPRTWEGLILDTTF